MTVEAPDGPPPRVERLFDALLGRDGAGGSWLSALLLATPGGPRRFGELADAPGWLQPTMAVRTETGRRGAFEQPVAPSPRLLTWYLDHPERLARPAAQVAATPESLRLRAALLDDDPPGARPRAQDRARELMRRGSPVAATWWRFEEAHRSDCVLITDRIVLLVRDGDDRSPATPWLPARSGRVRDLEAAQRLGDDAGRQWGLLTLGGPGPFDDDGGALAREVDAGAPHLDAEERARLLAGDVGEMTVGEAARVTGADEG